MVFVPLLAQSLWHVIWIIDWSAIECHISNHRNTIFLSVIRVIHFSIWKHSAIVNKNSIALASTVVHIPPEKLCTFRQVAQNQICISDYFFLSKQKCWFGVTITGNITSFNELKCCRTRLLNASNDAFDKPRHREFSQLHKSVQFDFLLLERVE